MPSISVIIPLYNKEKFIEKTLKSALEQTFSDFEVLIVDDGSTDKSASVVKSFNDERIRFFSKENEGVSATRNFGIDKSEGKFIAFLDADDYWHPTFLETIFALTKEFPNEKVFASAIEIETNGIILPAIYSIPKNEKPQIVDFFEGSHRQCVLFTSSTMFEKTIFEKTGKFDTSLKTDEDTDLWIRIGLENAVVFSYKIGARYIFDSKGLSKSKKEIAQKTTFSNYLELEKTNFKLQKFLNMHRFSIALKCKIYNLNEDFERFYSLIDKNALSIKQRILIALPSFALKKIYGIKLFLQQRKITFSAHN